MSFFEACAIAGLLLGAVACGETITAARRTDTAPRPYAEATEPKGRIDVQKHYSFRFVDKYRVSHDWFSGVNVNNCKYGRNVDEPGTFPEILGNPPEPNTPLLERSGTLHAIFGNRGEIRFYIPNERVYGTNGEGTFERYSPFCSQVFLTSRNGVGLLIIKPDPAKGTDKWVEGAKPVRVNDLNWLFKEIPARDMTGSAEGLANTIEIWTLKIPDTAYWLVVRFSADLKYSIQDHYEQHAAMLELFHRIVASVKLEPLSPSPH